VKSSEPTRAVHRQGRVDPAVHCQVLEQDPQLSSRSLGPPTNLPRRATIFVNRSAELAEVSALIKTAPLVTLTGVGGIGKSRLADVSTGCRSASNWRRPACGP
jgi:hypothetical protein